jgi:hypothetical protein
MMAFAKTDDMDITQRISTVLWEISLEYPYITENQVFKIVGFIDRVPENVSADDIVRRYYYILKIVGETNPNFNDILEDMIENVNGEFEEVNYKNLYDDLVKYKNKEINSFPNISKYF